MPHFSHGYVTCLYVPFYLVGDARAQIVAILLVYVSILACCSALCVGDSPRGPLKQWGKPHLNPGTETH
jgi:hypothetical protein